MCAIWGILEANLKKSSTLRFMTNISFVPSKCIHRPITLIFIEKNMLVDFFHGKYIFLWFSICISARILVSMTNSRLWKLQVRLDWGKHTVNPLSLPLWQRDALPTIRPPGQYTKNKTKESQKNPPPSIQTQTKDHDLMTGSAYQTLKKKKEKKKRKKKKGTAWLNQGVPLL